MDTTRYAAALGVVVAVAVVISISGAAMLATRYGGVWAGVTVGGLAVGVVGSIGLFALGQIDDQADEPGPGRRRGRF